MSQRILAAAATSALVIAVATPAMASAAPATSRTHTASHGSTSQASAPQASGAVSLSVKHHKRHYNGLSTSLNWAGYAQTGKRHSVTSVSSSFIVPKLDAHYNGYASTWVGIDGYDNQHLTQVGIAEEMVNGKASYYGWWEVITPTALMPERRFTMAIKPGQYITATVTVRNGNTVMSLWNRTTNKHVWHSVRYAGEGDSAEWIQEDVYVDGTVSRAPRWNKVAFTASTKNGKNPKFNYKQSIDIVDSTGVRETNTLKPNLIGNAFATTWLKAGHPSQMS